MKLKLLMLLFSLLSLTIYSQVKVVDETEVPEAIRDKFGKKFRNVSYPEWAMENEQYVVEFALDNKPGRASYDKDGNFIKSELEVITKTVPLPVVNYVDNNYKGLVIEFAKLYEFADESENYYYVTGTLYKGEKSFISEFFVKPTGELIKDNVPPEIQDVRKLSKEEIEKIKQEEAAKKEAERQEKEAERKEKEAQKEKEKAQTEVKEVVKSEEINEGSVPKAAKDHFDKKYGRMATETKWKENANTNEIIAEFLMQGAKNFSVYSDKGEWLMLQTETDPKTLPPPVITTVENTYPDGEITSVLNTVKADKEKYYDMKVLLSKGDRDYTIGVHMSTIGKIMREILPPSLEKEDPDRVDEKDVSVKAKNSFTKLFPKATDVKWSKPGENYTIKCFFKGEKTIATLSDTGKWIMTVKVLSPNTLNPLVTKYLEENYPKEEVSLAQYVVNASKEKYFYIETSTEEKVDNIKTIITVKQLTLSTAGKLITKNEVQREIINQEELAKQQAKEEEEARKKAELEKKQAEEEELRLARQAETERLKLERQAEAERLRLEKEAEDARLRKIKEEEDARLKAKKEEEDAKLAELQREEEMRKQEELDKYEQQREQEKEKKILAKEEKKDKDAAPEKGKIAIKSKELPTKIMKYITTFNPDKDPERLTIKEAYLITKEDESQIYQLLIKWQGDPYEMELYFDFFGNFLDNKRIEIEEGQ